MAFICGKCKDRHEYAIEAKACYAGALFACNWLVYDYNEDGRYERECGAPAIVTERGFTCRAGHSHVYAETRVQEGWEYAQDPQEAYRLAQAGVVPMTPDGSRVSDMHP
jgi:hypothetical protein